MTAERRKVLIVGGYGAFGGRLAELLAEEDTLTLFVAGRSMAHAEEFCARVPSRAKLVPLAFDRDGDLAVQLGTIDPDIVVDASGPFQSYGDDRYRVARAAIERGAHYIDIADSAEFVEGISSLDDEARTRGVFVLSGASSVPALTAAVVRRLERDFPPIESISAGIAPSPRAGIGPNVIRAIASYAGKPVALIRDGKPATGYALTESRRQIIAPPGALALKSMRFSLMHVPDLRLLPVLWPNVRSVWFGGGTVPEFLHRALNAMAWLVRLKILPSLAPLAGLMHRACGAMRWGEHRSGMFVTVAGVRSDGARVERTWHLVADGDDGMFVPAMAARAIIRRWLAGRPSAPGARPAVNDVELDAYEAAFAGKRIFFGRRENAPEMAQLPLYRRVLGEAFQSLPPPLQELHDLAHDMVASGRATVVRGGGMLARLIANMVGFPPAGHDVPVEVRFRLRRGGEEWRRKFDGQTFASALEAGRGRFEHLLCERFGPALFGLAVVIDGGRMRLLLRSWSLFGLPLPVAWAPFGECYEHAENGRFCFHVEIGHPLTGPIVMYHGWLVPKRTRSNSARQTAPDPALVASV
jgi:hypothetical protein